MENTDIQQVEVGKEYAGEVVKIVSFGAFVRILPNVEGLLHISQIAPVRIGQVEDVLNEGATVNVQCLEIDGKKIRLSMKEIAQSDSEVSQKLEKVIQSGGTQKPRDNRRGGYRDNRGGSRGGYGQRRDSNSDNRGGFRGRRDDNRNSNSEGRQSSGRRLNRS